MNNKMELWPKYFVILLGETVLLDTLIANSLTFALEVECYSSLQKMHQFFLFAMAFSGSVSGLDPPEFVVEEEGDYVISVAWQAISG